MEAASSAINKILSGAGQQESKKDESVAPAVDASTSGTKDTTVEQEVAPAVEHEHVKKQHETKEQTVVDRERHQDHYHTTIQPLKDQEVKAEKHDHQTAPTEYREVNKDAGEAKAKATADQAKFKSTTEEKQSEKTTKEDTIVGEQVHHHVHETIQPVIEKETIVPSTTHKTIPVKEVIKEQSQHEGITTNAPISVNEFAHKLDGSSKVERQHDGAPTISEQTSVAPK